MFLQNVVIGCIDANGHSNIMCLLENDRLKIPLLFGMNVVWSIGTVISLVTVSRFLVDLPNTVYTSTKSYVTNMGYNKSLTENATVS